MSGMLFDNGVDTPEVSEHRDLLRTLIDTHIRPTLTHAENAGLFPREVMTHPGAADIIRDRWRGHHGDRGKRLSSTRNWPLPVAAVSLSESA
ncbi:hypothetical protein V2I01_17655 [Micromonospora sp. BRA006-A]|nr:hypothetical protein [Micromonospora sp. BRA006-A]